MPRTRTEWAVIAAALVAILLLLTWWWWSSDPRAAFVAELQEEIDLINEGDYSSIGSWVSPQYEAVLKRQGVGNTGQAIAFAQQMDKLQGASYRMDRLLYWDEQNNDFAEVAFVRDTRRGQKTFQLPFIHRDGRWWIAGSFRSDGLRFPGPGSGF